MDAINPGTADFVAMIHRIVGIRARLVVTMPSDLKQLTRDLTMILSQDKNGGVDFANFFSLGVALARNPNGLTMSDISKVLDVPQSTATRIVDGMVTHKHLKRATDEADRRVVRISFTASGQSTFGAANELLRRRVGSVMTAFSDAERGQFLGYMHRLADVLEHEAVMIEKLKLLENGGTP